MDTNDFDEILKETELDSAKMILRLTSELKEKETVIASLRSKNFEEIRRNIKAKEAEFEALSRAQEARINKREAEIAGLLVEKEARLWQKHQVLLEEAIAKHRAELEDERTRLNGEVARKETEILEQKKALRAEMETLFKKWETEREEDFRNERKTFIEELKLGRGMARKEAEERAGRMEELWKEKLAQNAAEITARHEVELEEVRRGIQQKHLIETKTLTDRLNGEFTLKVLALREQLAVEEAAARKTLEENLRIETDRIAQQYRIKETGLAAQRGLINAQAQELEAKFMETLKVKEAENSDIIKKHLTLLNTRMEASRAALAAAAAELAEARRREEETVCALRADCEARLKEKDLQHEQLLQAREKQAFETARNKLELANKKAEEDYRLKLRDMESRQHALEQNLKFALQNKDAGQAQVSRLKEDMERISIKLGETENEKQKLIQENLSKSRDLRQIIEQEYADKLDNVEKNYLGQMADMLRRNEDKEKAQQDEYFKKLEFIKEKYASKFASQVKSLEDAYLERETRLLAALEEGYKLKEKALSTRFEQMESNYSAALADKTIQLDNDRSAAESVSRLKSELEVRNRELNSRISEHDKRLEEARQEMAASYAACKKELEDDHLLKTTQVENERAKLKTLVEQEQRLVTDLQKRATALQENYADKEAALVKEFGLSRERLENDYQARLKTLGGREDTTHGGSEREG